MHFLISPAIRLMQRLRIAHKFSLVAIAFTIPLLAVILLLFRELHTEAASANEKHEAIEKIQVYRELRQILQLQRSVQHMRLMGNKQTDKTVHALQTDIQKTLEQIHDRDAIEKQWTSLLEKQNSIKAPENFLAHTKLIETLNGAIEQIASTAKLTLDSDLVTHQLATIYMTTLPQLDEKIAVLSGRGAAYIDSGLLEGGEDIMLNSLYMLAKHELTLLARMFHKPPALIKLSKWRAEIADVRRSGRSLPLPIEVAGDDEVKR